MYYLLSQSQIHLLRRQLKRDFRKPLVVFSPKMILRHPRAVSALDEMAKGSFQEVLDDPQAKATNVDTVVFCSGKFYYEATEKAQELGVENMAFVRVEQLYPFPELQIKEKTELFIQGEVLYSPLCQFAASGFLESP